MAVHYSPPLKNYKRQREHKRTMGYQTTYLARFGNYYAKKHNKLIYK